MIEVSVCLFGDEASGGDRVLCLPHAKDTFTGLFELGTEVGGAGITGDLNGDGAEEEGEEPGDGGAVVAGVAGKPADHPAEELDLTLEGEIGWSGGGRGVFAGRRVIVIDGGGRGGGAVVDRHESDSVLVM
jgi:hypothetical protein